MLRHTDLPWRRPRRELLILSLVAVAALSPVYPQDSQDPSRLCLAQALSRGSLSADSCLSDVFDRSSHGGHLYSDKAPGLSILQLPSERIFGLGQGTREVACLLPPALGGPRAVGRPPVRPLRVPRRPCGRGARARLRGRFTRRVRARNDDRAARRHGLLARRHRSAPLRGVRARLEPASRRPAGIAAGAAVLTDYTAVLAAALIGAYVALRGARAAARYGVGRAPGDSAARALRLGRLRGAVAPLLPVRGQLLRRQTGLRPVRPRRAASAADIRGLCRPRRTARRVAGARDRGARAAALPARSSGRGRARRRRDRPLRAPQLQLLPSLRRALARAALSRSGASVPRPRPRTGIPAAPPNRRSRDGVLGRVDHRDRSRVALEQPHAGNGLGRARTGAGAARLVAFRPEPHRDDPPRARRRKRARRARRRRAGCGSGRRGARRPTLGEHPCGTEPQSTEAERSGSRNSRRLRRGCRRHQRRLRLSLRQPHCRSRDRDRQHRYAAHGILHDGAAWRARQLRRHRSPLTRP